MSDREFENYLQLLRGLLRLNRDQSEAISAELRSHMEDRLEELLALGIPREEAIQQALSEFGDAAGLGTKFGAIYLTRKRRWLMRLMTFSTAATLLVAASLITFWPGRNAAPGVASLEAQAPPTDRDPFAPLTPEEIAKARAEQSSTPAPEATSQTTKSAKPRNSASLRIDEQLDKTTNIHCVELPLKDVFAYLQEAHQIPIVLKLRKLDEASVPADTPVTKNLRGIRLSTALHHILDDLDLAYYIDDMLVITTPADAQAHPEVRIYDCRDILTVPAPNLAPQGDQSAPEPKGGDRPPGFRGGPPQVNEHERRAAQLKSILTTNVDPQSWAEPSQWQNGNNPRGNGSISEFNGLIVVTQTAQTHNKVEHVLNMLREAAGLDVTKAGKVVR